MEIRGNPELESQASPEAETRVKPSLETRVKPGLEIKANPKLETRDRTVLVIRARVNHWMPQLLLPAWPNSPMDSNVCLMVPLPELATCPALNQRITLQKPVMAIALIRPVKLVMR